MPRTLRLGIVGCGNIAGRYARDLVHAPQAELAGVTDIEAERAAALAEEYDTRAYPSLDDMLADDRLDVVVNLTVHHAHKAVSEQCLQAGKHVYSEKPLALTYDDARYLVELAQENGLRLGCSPFTFMGEGQQTAWKVIREGRLGRVRVVYAEVNWGRIETWHPAPEPFYQVGPLFDVGVYPLMYLTAMFGPAKRIWSYGRVLLPDRSTTAGRPFHVETPDFVLSVLEFDEGVTVRLTSTFYVTTRSTQTGIEWHGDDGSLYLSNWMNFDGTVNYAPFGEEYSRVPLVREGVEGVDWGRGVLEMVDAILEDRPHRATGEHAAHVVEILCAAAESIDRSAPVSIESKFAPPAPMPWAT